MAGLSKIQPISFLWDPNYDDYQVRYKLIGAFAQMPKLSLQAQAKSDLATKQEGGTCV